MANQTNRQPGELMVLRLSSSDGPRAQPEAILTSLARLGVEQGDLLGGDSLLVWVPDSKLAAAQKVAGSALQAYTPSARLAPSLVRVPVLSRQSRSQGAMVSVNVTVFQPEDKASVAQAAAALVALS